ncbi:hypothetical protein [Geodermatophilus chilensis]|uniref:hypothetical protein n=1 Tax=Geodermatophilus chilensis TaxID=2035835 RepID=UPI000C26B25C|nr:hypothetical protein [Geodermatophilus chilensis]
MTATHLPVVGVDLSLQATGIATAAGVRTIGSSGRQGASLRVRHARLADLATQVCLAVTEAAAPRMALVVLEAPAYDSRTGHQHDRSGLWWLVVDELLAAGHLVAEVTTGGLKKYATGKGVGKKAAIVSAVTARYGVVFGDDNQADAFVLRAMGMHRYGHPLATVPKTHAAALDAVAWPDVDHLAVTA